MADGAKPQKPTRPIPPTGLLISKTGPAQFGGSVHECIHTERRSSTGDKMNCKHEKKNERRIWWRDTEWPYWPEVVARVCTVCEAIE